MVAPPLPPQQPPAMDVPLHQQHLHHRGMQDGPIIYNPPKDTIVAPPLPPQQPPAMDVPLHQQHLHHQGMQDGPIIYNPPKDTIVAPPLPPQQPPAMDVPLHQQHLHHRGMQDGPIIYNPPKDTIVAPPLPPQQPPAMDFPLHQQHLHHRGMQDGPWSTGLCDCFHDISSCCLTYWCPCVTFGRISEIVDQGTTSCCVNGALYMALLCLTGCGCLFSCLYRTKMRRTFMLQESPCNDCCVHWCCDSCALCQEYRELQNRGFDMSIGWEGNTRRQINQGVAMAPSAPVIENGMKR